MLVNMILIEKETNKRELLWTPNLDEVNPKEEIISALIHYGDTYSEDEEGNITGEKYHIVFESL